MQPLFVGSHPAIDFLNTAFTPDGEQVETISDGRAYLDWLIGAGLLDEAVAARLARRFGAKALDAAAAEARKVREWTRGWLNRWRTAANGGYQEEVATLNKLLARQATRHEVIATGEGLSLVEWPRIENADALLGLIAAQIADLITKEEASLIKTCAGPKCTLWFLDKTKAHRRMFCSASACGNRAKVAAFRQRQRET
jgi:predicted RNA-binding Zn ribbon-like protein